MINHIAKLGGTWHVSAVLIGIFAILAASIALKSSYPLSFDENYHFTLVNYYSDNLSPLIDKQPAELNVVGDATRLGSYLYHYLISFPYRIIETFISGNAGRIIALRFVNILLAVCFLILARLLVARITKSNLISNLSLLIYVFLPVTSFLAAHINYDNLLLVGATLLFLIVHGYLEHLNKTGNVNVHALVVIVILCFLAPLIKFTFLPISLGVMIFVLARAIFKIGVTKILVLPKQVTVSGTSVLLTFFLILSAGLFAERYILNIALFRSPQPDCAAIQPLSVCQQYSPWNRNYLLAQAAPNDNLFEGRSFGGYVAYLWAPMMSKGLAYTGQEMRVYDPPRNVDYVIGLIVGLLVIGVAVRMLTRDLNGFFFAIVLSALLYFCSLLYRNYSEFMELHALIAVQGRYALPFMIPMTAYGIVGLVVAGKRSKNFHAAIKINIRKMVAQNPQVAYESTRMFISSKVWQRTPESS